MQNLAPRLLALVCLFAALSSAAPLTAQEGAPASETESVPDVAEKTLSEWERLIYLPYKDLGNVFQKEQATVFMPYAQFLRLWQSGGQPTVTDTKPPVAAVITKAEYVGRIDKSHAKIEAAFTVQVLGKPWAEIPLNFGEAAVGNISSSDERVLLRGTGKGTYSLLFPNSGEHKVTLELTVRVRTSPDGRSLEFPCPTVGITNLDLTVPAADQTIEITPKLVAKSVSDDPNVTRVQAGLGSTDRIAARWFPRVSTAPEMGLLATITNTTDVRVADGLIHTHASLAYRILRGQMDQIRISVPEDHRILDVTAPSLKGWKATKEQAGRVVTLDLLTGTARTITVEIRTERTVPDEPFRVAGVDEEGVVHGIHAVGAVRESGLIAVSHGGDITLPVEQQRGVVRIESTEVAKTLQRPGGVFYKFYSPNFDLLFSAVPVEPRIVADQTTRLEFGDDELRVIASLRYQVERAGVFELGLLLPEDFVVDDVVCPQMQKYATPEGSGKLVISLNQKTLGQFAVQVTGHLSLPAGGEVSKYQLPVLEPEQVMRETGTLLVIAPESLEVVTDEDAVIGAQSIRPGRVAVAANYRVASAWSYRRRPLEIRVTTHRKPTRLIASVGTTIRVQQELIEVISLIDYSVQYAGIDTFRFSVPESVGDVDIQRVTGSAGADIKQRSKADEAEEGWITWTVTMQRDVLGRQRFRVKYDVKPDGGEADDAEADEEADSSIPIRPLRVLDVLADEERRKPAVAVSRVTGEIAVLKERSLAIAAEADDLEAIDVRELNLLPRDGYLAYRYFKQPVEVRLTVTKHEIEEVVETVISRGLVEAVFTEDTAITYRCRFRVRSTERQRLPLWLPAGAELLGAMVAGKQAALEANSTAPEEKGWESYFVNVARSGGSDDPFYITVLFRIEATPFASWGGRLELRIPRLGDAKGVAIQQLRVAAWISDEYKLVGTPDGFTRDIKSRVGPIAGAISSTNDTSHLDSWIGQEASGVFEFPRAGHAFVYTNLGGARRLRVSYWPTALYAWLLSGTVFVIALVLAKTTWNNKLSVLLIAGFVASLAALSIPDVALHGMSAARYGIIAMLALWLIRTLAQVRPHADALVGAAPGGYGTAIAAVVPPPGVFEMLHSPPEET